MDADAAKGSINEQAKQQTPLRTVIEASLSKLRDDSPSLPDADEIWRRATIAFDDPGHVMDSGTIKEKRELIALYVQKIAGARDVTGHATSTVRAAFWSYWDTVAA